MTVIQKISLVIAASLISLVIGYQYASNWGPSPSQYPRQGIDVSNHQGKIDWARLPSQNVDFAFIKATEGGDFVDKSFEMNWEQAAKFEIDRGAYHFFTLCRSGSEQADNFIKTVPVDPKALPPVVDLEYLGNCSERPKIQNLHKELNDYIVKIENHYGKPVILYLTEEFNEAYQIDEKVDRPLWLRSLLIEPDFGNRPWAIWQVSNFRRLKGISGRVDWNVMRAPED